MYCRDFLPQTISTQGSKGSAEIVEAISSPCKGFKKDKYFGVWGLRLTEKPMSGVGASLSAFPPGQLAAASGTEFRLRLCLVNDPVAE